MKLGKTVHFLVVLTSVALVAHPVFGQQGGMAQTKNQRPEIQTSNPVETGRTAAGITAARGTAHGPKTHGPKTHSPTAPAAKTMATAKTQVKDIAFTASGKLVLTVLQPSGRPSSGQPVAIVYGSAPVAAAKTDVEGRVVISGLRPGVHVVKTGMTQTLVRFWSSKTAPPQAVTKPAIVDSSEFVRGQYGYGAPMAPGLVAATLTAVGVGAVVIGKNGNSENSPTNPASP